VVLTLSALPAALGRLGALEDGPLLCCYLFGFVFADGAKSALYLTRFNFVGKKVERPTRGPSDFRDDLVRLDSRLGRVKCASLSYFN